MDTEELIADLLADKAPVKARDFTLAWSEHRNTSWMNAARDAEVRAGSADHLPQLRGQLRHHQGEVALADAAHQVGAGVLPFRTKPAGGVFNVARIGRFALVSLTVKYPGLMPRRSATRKLLSQPNDALDPILELDLEPKPAKTITDLAYFGCLCAVAKTSDPTVPEILALGVPNLGMTEWISWTPLYRLQALLQQRADLFVTDVPESSDVPDRAFPTFRVPRMGTADNEQDD